MMIWLVGSPRSGSTFLCNFIGQYTDKKYNEAQLKPIETPRKWVFPKVKNIVFKHCENWKNIHSLANLYPKSVYVHVWRDPDNVVSSMSKPKLDSMPPRNLYGGYKGEERLRLCMQRWYSNTIHCLSLINIVPQQYIEIRYENMNPGLLALSEKTDLKMNLNELNFQNRNIEHLDLNWDLNKPAKQLRNIIAEFDGKCLACWLNRTRPKLLRRAIL